MTWISDIYEYNVIEIIICITILQHFYSVVHLNLTLHNDLKIETVSVTTKNNYEKFPDQLSDPAQFHYSLC